MIIFSQKSLLVTEIMFSDAFFYDVLHSVFVYVRERRLVNAGVSAVRRLRDFLDVRLGVGVFLVRGKQIGSLTEVHFNS